VKAVFLDFFGVRKKIFLSVWGWFHNFQDTEKTSQMTSLPFGHHLLNNIGGTMKKSYGTAKANLRLFLLLVSILLVSISLVGGDTRDTHANMEYKGEFIVVKSPMLVVNGVRLTENEFRKLLHEKQTHLDKWNRVLDWLQVEDVEDGNEFTTPSLRLTKGVDSEGRVVTELRCMFRMRGEVEWNSKALSEKELPDDFIRTFTPYTAERGGEIDFRFGKKHFLRMKGVVDDMKAQLENLSDNYYTRFLNKQAEEGWVLVSVVVIRTETIIPYYETYFLLTFKRPTNQDN